MRTLSDALKAAQQAGALSPLYKIVLTKGASSHTYEQDRIRPSKHDEEMYSHLAEIVLDNADRALDDIDLEGYDAVLSYGFAGEYSDTASLSVIDQQFNDDPNDLTCTLFLEGIPNLMARDEANANYVPEEDDETPVKDLVDAIAGATLDCFGHCEAYEVVWDDGYDALADTYKPKDSFRIYAGGSRLAAFRKVLDYTANVPRFEDDGTIHILKPVTSGDVFDSEYSLSKGSHSFFSKAYRNTLVFPNKVYVISQDDDDPQYLGTAQIDGYNDLPDKVKKIGYFRTRLESNDQAEDIAEALIAKAEMGSARGQAVIPINVGAEIFDYVKVTSSRQGDTRTGNLGYIHRRFGGDKWEMTFGFGNWLTALRYQKILKELETYTDAGNYFSRLMVGDLYAENILADNIDLVWIDPEGNIDLSLIGDTLDNLPDGENYARTSTINMYFDEDPESPTYQKWLIKLSENTVYSPGYDPSTKRRNFTSTPTTPYDIGDLWHDADVVKRCINARASGVYQEGDWLAVNIDQIADGATFQRTKTAALSAEGLVLLDQVIEGTFGKVQKASLSAAGLVLVDKTVDGTYGKTRVTQLDSGYLKLTSLSAFDGEWYDEGYIEIDADEGISTFGTGIKLYTATSTYRGCLGAEGSNFSIVGTDEIVLEADDDIVCLTFGDVRPASSNSIYLGTSSYYWQRVYAGIYYGKNTTIQSFQNHDDIALLRGIRHSKGKLDIGSFPVELIESDEEIEEARQNSITKIADKEQCIKQDKEAIKAAHKIIEDNSEHLTDRERTKALKKLAIREKNLRNTEDKFNSRKNEMLQSVEEARNVRGINMMGWQSLLMGSIIQLADKVEVLERQINNR